MDLVARVSRGIATERTVRQRSHVLTSATADGPRCAPSGPILARLLNDSEGGEDLTPRHHRLFCNFEPVENRLSVTNLKHNVPTAIAGSTRNAVKRWPVTTPRIVLMSRKRVLLKIAEVGNKGKRWGRCDRTFNSVRTDTVGPLCAQSVLQMVTLNVEGMKVSASPANGFLIEWLGSWSRESICSRLNGVPSLSPATDLIAGGQLSFDCPPGDLNLARLARDSK